jgi:hypothetical protein
MENMVLVSWRNLHEEGDEFSIPFSSFLHLLHLFSFIDLQMFIVVFVVVGLEFRA